MDQYSRSVPWKQSGDVSKQDEVKKLTPLHEKLINLINRALQ